MESPPNRRARLDFLRAGSAPRRTLDRAQGPSWATHTGSKLVAPRTLGRHASGLSPDRQGRRLATHTAAAGLKSTKPGISSGLRGLYRSDRVVNAGAPNQWTRRGFLPLGAGGVRAWRGKRSEPRLRSGNPGWIPGIGTRGRWQMVRLQSQCSSDSLRDGPQCFHFG